MYWSRFLIIHLSLGLTLVKGQNSHLLITSQGEGGLVHGENSPKEKLEKATFLPKNSRISIRPRSGIETLSSGFQFRFGSGTQFTIDEDITHLHSGSLLLNSRNIENQINIRAPETSVSISGSGCCLLEVETNGGLKMVGVLGRLQIKISDANQRNDLIPGELLFALPGEKGFGPKLNINLSKLIESSYLISGFPNLPSFEDSLEVITRAQLDSIEKKYGAKVGGAKKIDSFEIIADKKLAPETPVEGLSEKPLVRADFAENSDHSDPLSELLGRKPMRLFTPENSSHSIPMRTKLEQSPADVKDAPAEIFEESSNNPVPISNFNANSGDAKPIIGYQFVKKGSKQRETSFDSQDDSPDNLNWIGSSSKVLPSPVINPNDTRESSTNSNKIRPFPGRLLKSE